MIDISVAAWRAKWGDRQDSDAPLELSNEGPPRNAGKALLSDAQNSFLGTFVLTNLPRKDHDAFRKAVLMRLADGRPGTAAFFRALFLAAKERGFSERQLHAAGLPLRVEPARSTDGQSQEVRGA
jgi:hypothetical protein